MADPAELARLEHQSAAPPPGAYWSFVLDLGVNPEETWTRILDVVRIIANENAQQWPDDEAWRRSLPPWLLSFLMTAEECDLAMATTPRERWDQLPWEFGSWLDAIRDRDWNWWTGERLQDEANIVLQITGIPPRIDAFKQIVLAAGAKITTESY